MGTVSTPADASGFSLLFVCTANRCRSVVAAALARHALAHYGPAATGFSVASVGTEAEPGATLPPMVADLLDLWEIPRPRAFRARRLTPADLDRAGLVLTAGRDHLHDCLIARPGAARRCFTLREFARLTGALAPSAAGPGPGPQAAAQAAAASVRAAAVVAAAARARGQVDWVPPEEDEIADPHNAAALDRCAPLIDAAVQAAVAALCAPPR